jgi:hypothetical protein
LALITIADVYGTHWRCVDCGARMIGTTLLLRGRPIEIKFRLGRFLLDHAGENETVEFADLSCACGADSKHLRSEPIRPSIDA